MSTRTTTRKDILGHVTFWHERFTRNISDLGNGILPSPLKGKLSEVNKRSVETTKSEPIERLVARLKKAQVIIEQHVFDEKMGLTPYKKGSRDYDRVGHLEVVANHIRKHLKELTEEIWQGLKTKPSCWSSAKKTWNA
ncbi:MAG: hypothetical protein AAGA66_10985 [Bacteroidota bacterium]